MKRVKLLYILTLLPLLISCGNNEEEPADPFMDIKDSQSFGDHDISLFVNGEKIEEAQARLTLDTLESGATMRNAMLKIELIPMYHHTEMNVRLEKTDDNTFHVTGMKVSDGCAEYKVDGELIFTHAPYTYERKLYLSLNMTYTVLSEYAGNSYMTDFTDSPFTFKYYSGDSTEIDGINIKNYTIQKKTCELINKDLYDKGLKVKLSMTKDGLLSVYTSKGDSDEYELQHTVRYWWIDGNEHRFITDLSGLSIYDFDAIWITDASGIKVRYPAYSIFHNYFTVDMYGTPFPGLLNSNIEITPAYNQASVLYHAAAYRELAGTWNPKDIEYLSTCGRIFDFPKKDITSQHLGWTMKFSTIEFNNWGN